MTGKVTFEDYVPAPAQARQGQALITLLQRCDAAGIAVSVLGGYGLDALYGKLTRDHGDFDLLVESQAYAEFVGVLAALGYEHAPDWSEPGRKEAYRQRTLGPSFKLEFATLDSTKLASIAQRYGVIADISMFFPATPNGQLLDYPVRTPTLEGIEVFHQVQQQTAIERGWAEFPHRHHQEALLTVLKSRK